MHFFNAAAIAGLLLPSLALAQCVNEVANWNPNARTMTVNGTSFLIPVPRAAVQKVLDKQYGPGVVQLTTVPVNDKTLFPGGGFDTTKYHPVYTTQGFVGDTRMAVAQIQGNYLSAVTNVPYVRRSESAAGVVLQAHIISYLAGQDNGETAVLVPSTVSALVEGFYTSLGEFIPEGAAWQTDQNGLSSQNAAWKVVPNPVSGPGVIVNAAQQVWIPSRSALTSVYTPKLWKAIMNQPAILNSSPSLAGLCQRNQFYFNNATGVLYGRTGNVTLGDGADASLIDGTLAGSAPGGFYSGLSGFSACAQNVGFNPEPCDQAYKNTDQSAL